MQGLTPKIILLLFMALVAGFFWFDPEPAHHSRPPVVAPSEEAIRIHREAIVIDLHTDSLLWPRDLNRSGEGGHVDFPRMRRGGLDAVAFTIVTRAFGVAGLKAFHDLWPVRTWFSPEARYIHQIERMARFLDASEGQARRATTPEALRDNHNQGVLSVFHGIEGAHAFGNDVSKVRQAARAGVVFIGPVHLSDNTYAGTSMNDANHGLTDRGRGLIQEMNEAGVLLDLAHASPRAFEEAIQLTSLPPLVSHAGARGVFDTWRNLTDGQIQAVADRGGVIGVMYGPPGLSRPDLEEVVEHIAHIVSVGGENAAALGSDFDGYIEAPIDATGLVQLTELMLRKDWSERRIKKILGENFLRVLGARVVSTES
jgi:microsomal dipeptidase-like Zn-dependent dipeptidase